MRLTLTTDDGEVLDTTTLTATEYAAETARNPAGILAQLQPGREALR